MSPYALNPHHSSSSFSGAPTSWCRPGEALADARPSGLHTRPPPESRRTAESCEIQISVGIITPLPCAHTSLSAHGNPTTNPGRSQ